MTARTWSDLTVSDFFCGAGGNTIGAKAAGLRVRVGLNHWQRAIDTYGANNPDVDIIERVDISACDPRRYPSTDIGIFSPECTTHSPAGGNKHRPRGDFGPLFGGGILDPATVRSRVTMWDVVRFAELHAYRLVVVENVVEATRWVLWPDWLRAMTHLGYAHQVLSLNSMFFHPTPQSRDRIYVVFWRKGNRAPRLDHRPLAPCARCGTVESVQVWNAGRTIGKYKRQYRYACARCAREVTPFYYAALNALDFSLAADRIGDRKRPLKPRTMERIAFGLAKYGRRALVVQTNMTSGVGCRVRDGVGEPMPTQAASAHHAWLAPAPFIVGGHLSHRVAAVDAPLGVQSASRVHDGVVMPAGFLVPQQGVTRALGFEEALPSQLASCAHEGVVQFSSALVSPFLVSAGCRETTAAGTDPMPTQLGSERLGVVSPFIVALANGGGDERRSLGVDDPLRTVHAGGGNHAVITGAAQLSMRDADAMRVAGLDRELLTQGCGPQQAIVARAPFLVQQYGTNNASPIDAALPVVTAIDRHEYVQPGDLLRVEDCYFRMLQPHEIGAAMAFPVEYVVGGNKRDRVKQYGNAVTPPVMDFIVRQCAASLAPELEGAA